MRRYAVLGTTAWEAPSVGRNDRGLTLWRRGACHTPRSTASRPPSTRLVHLSPCIVSPRHLHAPIGKPDYPLISSHLTPSRGQSEARLMVPRKVEDQLPRRRDEPWLQYLPGSSLARSASTTKQPRRPIDAARPDPDAALTRAYLSCPRCPQSSFEPCFRSLLSPSQSSSI